MFDMPVFRWVSDYLRTVTSTTYVILFLLFNLINYANGIVLTWIMDTYYPHYKDDPGFLNMFNFLQFLMPFIYTGLLSTIMDYPDPIVSYRSYLQLTTRIAMAAPDRDELCDYLGYMVDAGEAFRSFPISHFRQLQHRQLPIKKVTDDLLTTQENLMRAFITMGKLLDTSPRAHDDLNKLIAIHQNMDPATGIRQQNYTAQTQIFFLVVYFGIWLPAYIWASTDSATTIRVFPILCFVIGGPFLQRWWLGDPWDGGRPFKESNHENWPLEFKKKLCFIYGRPFKNV